MFERKSQRLISRKLFAKRMLNSLGLALLLTCCSLLIGVEGYHQLGGLGWVDALLNASMILGGMGPVDILRSDDAKIFASIYALYSGLFMLVSMGILLAPVMHRVLHHFHADEGRA